jgi:DNA-binding transcriptional MerR regulator
VTAVPQPSRDPAPDTADTAPRFTIGEVLGALRGDFPEVTISKIRYLESEELVHPQRTPSGYRKFSSADVARLRYVLAAQRDQYLPLRVIKEHLDALDRGEPQPGGADGGSATGEPVGTMPLPAAEFARAAGLTDEQLADCVQFGLVTPDAQGRHLLEQLVAPVLRARSDEARARAAEQLDELAALSAQLHGALLEGRLREVLGP